MPAALASPKSAHTADPLLRPFLGPSFDPTTYLNTHIPALAFPTPAAPVLPAKHQALPDVAAATSAHVAQLAAQLAGLCDTLTRLTDDILRGAPRLAYSVELLRGDANALSDSLREGLAEDVARFVPGGLDAAVARLQASDEAAAAAAAAAEEAAAADGPDGQELATAASPAAPAAQPPNPLEPAALARLRTLHQVRARLAEVTGVFDRALAWPLPPSARSTGAASFVTVSAPAPGEARLEEQGQEAQRVLRESVTDLLNDGRPEEGVLKAEKRLRELRELCEVWKGTAEEKPRTRFVDGLAKLVADRRREEEQRGTLTSAGEEDDGDDRGKDGDRRGGLFSGFRRLRNEIYLE